jgi:hypothetical protein
LRTSYLAPRGADTQTTALRYRHRLTAPLRRDAHKWRTGAEHDKNRERKEKAPALKRREALW